MTGDVKNLGVMLGQRQEDYIAGATSPLPYVVNVPDGDWTPYMPSGERQASRKADSMACVSFSALNCVEAQIKRLTGIEINLSDRALAKLSNTTANGNYLWRVGDALRKFGAPLESAWPAPADFTWEQYYAPIPDHIVRSGAALLIDYDIKYEWLPDTARSTLLYHLKQSPLQVVIPGHAVMAINSRNDVEQYFDSYAPYTKSHAGLYQTAMKYVVSKRAMFDLYQIAGSKEVWIVRTNDAGVKEKTHIYNAAALTSISTFAAIKPIAQDDLDAIPDSGNELAAIVRE